MKLFLASMLALTAACANDDPSTLDLDGDGQPSTQSKGPSGATGSTTEPTARPSILRRPGTTPKVLPGNDGASSGSPEPSKPKRPSPRRPSVLFPKLRR